MFLDELWGNHGNRLFVQHPVEAFVSDRNGLFAKSGDLLAQHGLWNRPVPFCVAPLTLFARGVEQHRVGRDPGLLGSPDPAGPALLVESERIDHRGELAAEPLVDDSLEKLECRGPGLLIVRARPGHGPQCVGGHHLVLGKVLEGPRGLAGGVRTNQNDQRWGGESRLDRHPPVLG